MPKYLCVSAIRHGHVNVPPGSGRNISFYECIEIHDVDQYLLEGEHHPLSSEGQRQVKILGRQWADVHIDALYSSPLERAHDTAKALTECNRGHPEVLFNDDLVERTYGGRFALLVKEPCTEGWYQWPDNRERLHGALYGPACGKLFCQDRPRSYIPDGGGESLEGVAARTLKFLMSILREHAVEGKPYERTVEWKGEPVDVPDGIPHVVLVSHGDFILELDQLLQEWNQPKHRWAAYALGNAHWHRYVLEWDEDDRHVKEGHAKEYGRLNMFPLKGFYPP